MKYCLYETGIYPIKLMVAISEWNEDDEERKQLEAVITPLSKISLTDTEAITFQALYKEDDSYVVCILFNGPQLDDVWAHEADHFVNMLFIFLEIDMDLHNDEPHAYLLEWAYNRIRDFFKSYVIEKKKK